MSAVEAAGVTFTSVADSYVAEHDGVAASLRDGIIQAAAQARVDEGTNSSGTYAYAKMMNSGE